MFKRIHAPGREGKRNIGKRAENDLGLFVDSGVRPHVLEKCEGMDDASTRIPRVGTELSYFIGELYPLVEVFISGTNNQVFESISISIVLSMVDFAGSALKNQVRGSSSLAFR